ncbi:hypothetical protein [Streptomyces albidochromogenes]|uniref:Uncharacterized protein n=1 Tax=Streptomyces albidochromogenes TaxID=329524 RepID=A0ABW6FJR6_9ACTN
MSCSSPVHGLGPATTAYGLVGIHHDRLKLSVRFSVDIDIDIDIDLAAIDAPQPPAR